MLSGILTSYKKPPLLASVTSQIRPLFPREHIERGDILFLKRQRQAPVPVTNLKGLVTSSWPSSSDMMDSERFGAFGAGGVAKMLGNWGGGRGIGTRSKVSNESGAALLSESDVPDCKMCASGAQRGQWGHSGRRRVGHFCLLRWE